MQFKEADYGLIPKIIAETYHPRAGKDYGARAGASPLIFLVTAGSMRGVSTAVFQKNMCGSTAAGQACGTNADNASDTTMTHSCMACWRKSLAEKLDTLPVIQRTCTCSWFGLISAPF